MYTVLHACLTCVLRFSMCACTNAQAQEAPFFSSASNACVSSLDAQNKAPFLTCLICVHQDYPLTLTLNPTTETIMDMYCYRRKRRPCWSSCRSFSTRRLHWWPGVRAWLSKRQTCTQSARQPRCRCVCVCIWVGGCAKQPHNTVAVCAGVGVGGALLVCFEQGRRN